MKIGVPRERKVMEFRAGMIPSGIRQLCAAGHEVVVESGLGLGCGFSDQDYAEAGARVSSVEDVWASELVVKVNEGIVVSRYFVILTLLFALGFGLRYFAHWRFESKRWADTEDDD